MRIFSSKILKICFEPNQYLTLDSGMSDKIKRAKWTSVEKQSRKIECKTKTQTDALPSGGSQPATEKLQMDNTDGNVRL